LGATLAMVFVAQLFRRPRLRDVPENHESCLASVSKPHEFATRLRVPHWGFDLLIPLDFAQIVVYTAREANR